MASNWSELTDDLLTLITDKLKFIKDYVRFGATCLKWHSVFSKNSDRLPAQPPLLMIPKELNREKQITSLYSVLDGSFYDIQVSMPHNLHCCGSSFGWIFTQEESSSEVHLINPLFSINNKIRLPSLDTLDYSKIRKVVLSANPASTPDYAVLIIHGVFSRLALFKADDKIWTSIESEWDDNFEDAIYYKSEWDDSFEDAIYYKGQFYAIHRNGKVIACDLSSSSPKLIEVAPPWNPLNNPMKMYLAELSGNLLLIIKDPYFGYDWKNQKFKVGYQVFKLEPMGWVKMPSLGNFALFLGRNSSMSVLASDFPGCEPNHIYSTDDGISASSSFSPGLRVIDMVQGIVEPSPIWVELVLQGCT